MIFNKLRALRDRLLGTLWFVPSIVVVAFLLLAVGMVDASTHVDREVLARWPLLFGANAESSRSILAAVASGMITVAGLTFSLTLLAVTQASSQFTPRILRNFLGDRANQLMLGTFVGVFAYCILVLRTIRGGENNSFVPSLAVVLGMVLGIVGIGVLIVAVHHIASSLQASSIVAGVAAETVESVDRLFPDQLDAGSDPTLESDRRAAVAIAEGVDAWHAVPASRSGYIQSVDLDGLVARGSACGRLIRVECCPGDFVIEGRALASLAIGTSEALTNDKDFQQVSRQVAQSFTIGLYRTVEQDPPFGIRQLVDIALKALSPGINDTTTAVSCVHYLGAILTRVANRRIDVPVARHDGEVRVLPRGPSFGNMLSLSFDQIRQSAEGNVAILKLLMRTAAMVAEETSPGERRDAAIEQLSLLRENAGRTVGAPHDRRALRDCYRECLSVADRSGVT
ncbi:MAG: DUF2254 domain-containing protein [Gemmatimonadota bacterium]